jgi:hypothetical protein
MHAGIFDECLGDWSSGCDLGSESPLVIKNSGSLTRLLLGTDLHLLHALLSQADAGLIVGVLNGDLLILPHGVLASDFLLDLGIALGFDLGLSQSGCGGIGGHVLRPSFQRQSLGLEPKLCGGLLAFLA